VVLAFIVASCGHCLLRLLPPFSRFLLLSLLVAVVGSCGCRWLSPPCSNIYLQEIQKLLADISTTKKSITTGRVVGVVGLNGTHRFA